MLRRLSLALIGSLALMPSVGGAQQPREPTPSTDEGAGTRTIEFETTEVTQADVTVSPDDRWLVFTILGHLFRMPIAGGVAEQLTFGPYYDSDPVFSPDGQRIAFVSDREDSDRNIFNLDLATGQITQVTREPWADRPVWSPDGRWIVYLSQVGEPRPFGGTQALWLALVRQIEPGGGQAETLSPRRHISSAFYLRDGRLAWTVMEPEGNAFRPTTRVEVLGVEGTVSELRSFDAFPNRVIASPTGEELYCRCYAPFALRQVSGTSFPNLIPSAELFVVLPLPEGPPREIFPLSTVEWRHNVANNREPLRFGVTSDNLTLYVGDTGRIWRIQAENGVRQAVPFSARVKLEIHDPVVPRNPNLVEPGASAPPRVVSQPRLSPNGRTLVFGAAGYLWQQPLEGGPARRLFEGTAWDLAFSPDGRQLAYVREEDGREEIRVFNFDSRESRTLGLGWGASWSRDGERLVFVQEEGPLERVVSATLSDGRTEILADLPTGSSALFSATGEWLYFLDAQQTLNRFQLSGSAIPQPVARLDRGLRDPVVSPDGRWLAFRRNADIWIAPLGSEPVRETDLRLLSTEGTADYAFTPDNLAMMYSVGNRVWQHSLADGTRDEVPIRLEIERPTAPPVLLRRVRVLDYDAGGFGEETSLYIDRGRIRWMGSEIGKSIPPDASIVDAEGRFAIPGLFDMHTHVSGWQQDAFIAYGVTSIRDAGSPLNLISAWADLIDFSAGLGPRSFYAGDSFNYGAESAVGQSVAVRDVEDARRYVRRWAAQGVQFIKAYSSLSWKLRRAVAEEAHAQGLPVVGHGMSVEEITKSVILGFASLEHFNRQSRNYDDIMRMLVAAGTYWDPTLEAPHGNALLLRNEPERLADGKLRAMIPERILRNAQRNLSPVDHTMLRGLWVDWLEGIEPAQRLGVKLLAGTDASDGPPGIIPGISLHWELEHLVQGGLSPLDALRIATAQAAEALGAGEHLGTLELGKLADIVILDGSPLEDIKNTQTIWRVLKEGWLHDPDVDFPPASTGR